MLTIKRPRLISTICVLGFTGTLVSFLWVFSPAIKTLGDWYPALFGLLNASGFISYIGLWHMKRWGVLLYVATFFARTAVLISVGDSGVTTFAGIVVGVIFITILGFYYKRMDVNL